MTKWHTNDNIICSCCILINYTLQKSIMWCKNWSTLTCIDAGYNMCFFRLFEKISGVNVLNRSIFVIDLLKGERLVSWWLTFCTHFNNKIETKINKKFKRKKVCKVRNHSCILDWSWQECEQKVLKPRSMLFLRKVHYNLPMDLE